MFTKAKKKDALLLAKKRAYANKKRLDHPLRISSAFSIVLRTESFPSQQISTPTLCIVVAAMALRRLILSFLLPGQAQGRWSYDAIPGDACQLIGAHVMDQKIVRENTDTAHTQAIVPIYVFHTLEVPFCPLPGCHCHTNQQEIAKLLDQIKDGVLTLREAADFVDGKLVY